MEELPGAGGCAPFPAPGRSRPRGDAVVQLHSPFRPCHESSSPQSREKLSCPFPFSHRTTASPLYSPTHRCTIPLTAPAGDSNSEASSPLSCWFLGWQRTPRETSREEKPTCCCHPQPEEGKIGCRAILPPPPDHLEDSSRQQQAWEWGE